MKAMRARRKRMIVAAGMAAGLVAGGATPANAQDIKIEVTGSNIKRVEGEGSLPVTIMTRQDIERSGATSAVELLSLVAANNSAGAVALGNVIGSTTFSAQTASLRGLGGGRTLVLLNGKRLTNFAGEIQGVQGVNLTAIPFNAIQRVEVLKDGASAIYGSDAIGGVINFIVSNNYQGAEATAYAGTPTRSGGGDQYKLQGSLGWGDLSKDRYNAFFSFSYDKQRNLEQRDRDFANSSFIPSIGLFGLSGNTFPGHISTGDIGVPSFPNCAPSRDLGREWDDVFGARCWYDPAQQAGVQMIPDNELWNAYASGTFQINKDWQAYATGLYARQETRYVIQPVPLSDQFTIPAVNPIAAQAPYFGFSRFLLPPTSPFYPHGLAAAAGVDGEPLNIRYRAVENGNRDTTDTNEAWQIVTGIRGSAWNWDFDASFQYNEGRTKSKINGGFPLLSRIMPLLNSGVVDPFGPNSADVTAQVQATNYVGPTFDGTSKHYGVTAKASGDIWQLPAGPLSLAAGVDTRREQLTQDPAPVLATGDLSGFGGNILPIDQSRDVWALFTELNVPIIKNLEGNVAVRYDHYSDFGSTTNPKVSLRWQPARWLLMRASWGTGFLAPSLFQLWTPNVQGTSSTGLSDPLRCPTTNDSNDCNTQFPVTFGGNPSLKPEESEQASVGFVLEPFEGMSLSIDYFKLRLSEVIVNGVAQSAILDDLAQYGHLVTRAPVQPQFPGIPGPIVDIDQKYINLGGLHIEGLDIDARYATPQSSIGRLRFGLQASYYIRYDAQQADGSWLGGVSNAKQSAATGISPRLKTYATVGWDYGAWNVTLANSYQSSYIDWQTDFDGNERRVGSMSLWDLQGSYAGFKNTTLTVGVKNLFDTNPPVTNQQNTFQLGFDPSYYDPRARFLYGSVRYAFK